MNSVSATTTTSAAASQNYGEVFTRRWIADAVLDLVGYTADKDLAATILVEPAAGSGAFLVPAIERLLSSAHRFNHPIDGLDGAVRAWELREDNARSCAAKVQSTLVAAGASIATARRLTETWIQPADFLLADTDLFSMDGTLAQADFIVGNPPYIRLEDLPAGLSAAYRRRWRTMGGRADVYIGFFERSIQMLKPGGRLGFICADRWMRNQYGANLREYIAQNGSIEEIWTMHDVDAFEEPVSAYPAIVVIEKKQQGAVRVANALGGFGPSQCARLLAWSGSGSSEVQDTAFSAHRLPHWFPGSESWPTGSPGRLRLIELLNDEFAPLENSGTHTRVGIGIATGADKAFITRDPDSVEPDRLLPLSMVRDIADGSMRWSGNYLVNPWDRSGRLVDLDAYPRLRRYFESLGPALRGRFVAKKRPDSWFRTIDKVDDSLIDREKILLQDMRTTIHPVLDSGGFYPHHNLYYVVSSTWDMEVLGGLLLSRVAQAFIEAYCVRMRGGTLRFQAQYLRKIRVPEFNDLSETTREALRAAFRSRDSEAATTAALRAYNLRTEQLVD